MREALAKYLPSGLALVCSVTMTVLMGMAKPTSIVKEAGYGISSLGGFMLSAACLAGTFNLFHLTQRWQVYTAGAVFVLVGIVLMSSNS